MPEVSPFPTVCVCRSCLLDTRNEAFFPGALLLTALEGDAAGDSLILLEDSFLMLEMLSASDTESVIVLHSNIGGFLNDARGALGMSHPSEDCVCAQ